PFSRTLPEAASEGFFISLRHASVPGASREADIDRGSNAMRRDMFNVIETSGAPIKAWTDGVPVEDSARQQLINVASLPFIHKHVAVMPDVHWGMGATVGSVIPTKGAIIPAAVGVDIGCGMVAARTSLRANDLPDDLSGIRSAIEAAVPHGRTEHGGAQGKGAWQDIPAG